MSLQHWNAPDINPYVKKVKALVITCIDPRFTYFLSWFLNHEKEIHDSYDLFALAGSSMCALNTTTYPKLVGTGTTLPSTTPWLTTLDNHVTLASALHSIAEIWIFDHLGCGAYQNYISNDSVSIHVQGMGALQTHISANYPNIKFKTFLMDLEGNIDLYSSTGGLDYKRFTLSSYSPQVLPWVLFYVTVFLWFASMAAILRYVTTGGY